MSNHAPDPLSGTYSAKCTSCGWGAAYKLNLSAGLKVGDTLYRDPQNENFGKCRSCKRYKMQITAVPPGPSPNPPKGFWKVPTS